MKPTDTTHRVGDRVLSQLAGDYRGCVHCQHAGACGHRYGPDDAGAAAVTDVKTDHLWTDEDGDSVPVESQQIRTLGRNLHLLVVESGGSDEAGVVWLPEEPRYKLLFLEDLAAAMDYPVVIIPHPDTETDVLL